MLALTSYSLMATAVAITELAAGAMESLSPVVLIQSAERFAAWRFQSMAQAHLSRNTAATAILLASVLRAAPSLGEEALSVSPNPSFQRTAFSGR